MKFSYVTSTLLMISKYGNLVQLGQYFFIISIYNKFSLDAILWSYRAALKWGTKVATSKNTKKAFKAAEVGAQIYNTLTSRDLEDNDEYFVRDLDAFDDLEAREPGGLKAAKSVFFHPSIINSH